MEYTVLGKSGLKVSRIGFGCMSLDLTHPQSESLLLDALDGGINYFDTADMYNQGENERFLGRVFQKKRKELILATKVGNQWRPDGSGWDWNPTPKYILAAVEQSLIRLRTDYIDLYQLHGGTLEDPMDEIIEVFERLKAEGKIRHYGISSIRPNVIREYVKRSNIASVMMQYSSLDRRPEEEMLPFLSEHQIGVIARGVLAKGLLVSKPPKAFLNYSEKEVHRQAEAIISMSRNHQNAFSTAVKWVFNNPAISASIIGIRTEEQLQSALQAENFSKLNQDQLNTLQSVLKANRYTEHR